MSAWGVPDRASHEHAIDVGRFDRRISRAPSSDRKERADCPKSSFSSCAEGTVAPVPPATVALANSCTSRTPPHRARNRRVAVGRDPAEITNRVLRPFFGGKSRDIENVLDVGDHVAAARSARREPSMSACTCRTGPLNSVVLEDRNRAAGETGGRTAPLIGTLAIVARLGCSCIRRPLPGPLP